MIFRILRRDSLAHQVPLLPLLGDVLGRAPGEGQDRPGAVLVGVGDERAAVGHEEVLHLVGLAPLVEHRRPRAVAHAGGAHLVDDLAALADAVVLVLARHGEERVPPAFSIIAGRSAACAAPGGSRAPTTPSGSAARGCPSCPPPSDRSRSSCRVGDHLAPAGKLDDGAVVPAVVVLQALPYPPPFKRWMPPPTVAGHAAAAAELDVVAAREVQLAVVSPPRHVDVHVRPCRPRCGGTPSTRAGTWAATRVPVVSVR